MFHNQSPIYYADQTSLGTFFLELPSITQTLIENLVILRVHIELSLILLSLDCYQWIMFTYFYMIIHNWRIYYYQMT